MSLQRRTVVFALLLIAGMAIGAALLLIDIATLLSGYVAALQLLKPIIMGSIVAYAVYRPVKRTHPETARYYAIGAGAAVAILWGIYIIITGFRDAPPETGCRSKVSPDINLCDMASVGAREMALQLPRKVSENYIVASASALGPRIISKGIWRKDRTYIEALAARQKITIEQLISGMKQEAKTGTCEDKSAREFTRLGGEMEFTIELEDSSVLFTQVITSCD